jgi:predicted nucleic acid-binding protein
MILYLETSNLVKLYIAEQGTEKVKSIVNEAEIVATSIIAYTETRAAFSRKFRERGITEKEYKRIKREFEKDWEKYFILLLTLEAAKSAGDLAEKHNLRAFDALHLASALSLKDRILLSSLFSSSDRKLCEAAEKEGLKAPHL